MVQKKRVLKKNNLIRPANRKTRMIFVKRREIGLKKIGKSCFLHMRLWLS